MLLICVNLPTTSLYVRCLYPSGSHNWRLINDDITASRNTAADADALFQTLCTCANCYLTGKCDECTYELVVGGCWYCNMDQQNQNVTKIQQTTC